MLIERLLAAVRHEPLAVRRNMLIERLLAAVFYY